MTGLFETRSVEDLVNRNLTAVREVFEYFCPDDDYADFVSLQRDLLEQTDHAALRELLEGYPIRILGASETVSLLLSLEYSYLLTLYAEKTASEGSSETALVVLVEASYYAGLAQGVGVSAMRYRNRNSVDRTLSASNAAKARVEKNSTPVKNEILRLLEIEHVGRNEKWKSTVSAISRIHDPLSLFLIKIESRYNLASMDVTVNSWCRKDPVFRGRFSQFVKLKGS